MESGLNAKEIEMGTTAESLELRFRLYLTYYEGTTAHNEMYVAGQEESGCVVMVHSSVKCMTDLTTLVTDTGCALLCHRHNE